MFTFSFSSAFAGTFNAETSADKTALITVAQTELAASAEYLDTVKAYYLKNFENIGISYGDDTVTVEKAAVEKIIDDVFADIAKKVTKVYEEVLVDINAGSVDVDGVDDPALADAKTAVKTAIQDEYKKYSAGEIKDYIKDYFAEEAVEAQFDVVKADALATLDKVNFGNYSTTSPDEVTYAGKYYSNQQIAKAIVDDAKKDINAVKFGTNASANAAAINGGIKAYVDDAVVEIDDVYYVLATTDVTAGAAKETVGSDTLVKRAATEAKDEKTLAEEKAYQISVVNGKISLAEAKIRKELNAKLDTKLDDATKKVFEDALADLTKYMDACKEVAAAQINYAEDNDEAKDTGKWWTDECDAIIDADTEDFTKAEVEDYVDFFKGIIAITEKVDALEAEAAKLKAQTGFNGAPLYDAAEIDDALEKAIEAAYFGEDATIEVYPNEDLVKAEMNRVLTGSSAVTLNKVVYPVVADWLNLIYELDDDDSNNVYADASKLAEADKIVRETIDAIRAAKTVEDVDAAFVAGYEKFKAVPTEEDKDDFWGEDSTGEAVDKYAAKLDAALVEKIADYGSAKFEKDYDLGEDFLDNLVEKYLSEDADVYTTADLAAGYEKALAEIKNLKTKAELEAEQKAINEAILAIKAPVTEADEATVVALVERYLDFVAYRDLIDADGTYTVYDSLLGQYIETLMDLADENLDDAYDAIYKGGITVEDEAAIAEYEKMAKDFIEKYVVLYYGMPEELVDLELAAWMADLKAELVEAKADEVEAAIAKIDASAKPLDVAAIKAAREAYDALGEVRLDNTALYHKLLSLENLVGTDAETAKALLADINIIARSTRVAKGIKVTVTADVSALEAAGFTVEYKFYRSTKKSSGYVYKLTSKTGSYTNTAGTKGVKYYYKAKLVVKNAAGEVVAESPIKQCSYACRTWTK